MSVPRHEDMWPAIGCCAVRYFHRTIEITVLTVFIIVGIMAFLPASAMAQNYWQKGQFYSKKTVKPRGRHGAPVRVQKKGNSGLFGNLFGGKSLFSKKTQPARQPVRELMWRQQVPNYRHGLGGSRHRGQGVAGRSGGGYRTMCVRTCDGFYFPVSFQTGAGSFATDEAKCQSSCDSDARLFYYANPGEPLENMRDRRGIPYSKLKNAFRFRKEFVADCRCKPEPWTKEARRVHKAWAQIERGQAPVVEADRVKSGPVKVMRGRRHSQLQLDAWQ